MKIFVSGEIELFELEFTSQYSLSIYKRIELLLY